MKTVTSYKLYNKIMRKYYERNWRKYHSIWKVWLSYTITTPDEAMQVLRTKQCQKSYNLSLILTEFIKDCGQLCYFHGLREQGILTGIEMTNEDYYYVYKLENGKISYESCCGGYDRV